MSIHLFSPVIAPTIGEHSARPGGGIVSVFFLTLRFYFLRRLGYANARMALHLCCRLRTCCSRFCPHFLLCSRNPPPRSKRTGQTAESFASIRLPPPPFRPLCHLILRNLVHGILFLPCYRSSRLCITLRLQRSLCRARTDVSRVRHDVRLRHRRVPDGSQRKRVEATPWSLRTGRPPTINGFGDRVQFMRTFVVRMVDRPTSAVARASVGNDRDWIWANGDWECYWNLRH